MQFSYNNLVSVCVCVLFNYVYTQIANCGIVVILFSDIVYNNLTLGVC